MNRTIDILIPLAIAPILGATIGFLISLATGHTAISIAIGAADPAYENHGDHRRFLPSGDMPQVSDRTSVTSIIPPGWWKCVRCGLMHQADVCPSCRGVPS